MQNNVMSVAGFAEKMAKDIQAIQPKKCLQCSFHCSLPAGMMPGEVGYCALVNAGLNCNFVEKTKI